MGLIGTLGELIRKALLVEGRAPRQGFYKRSPRKRAKNRFRQGRRVERAINRARRAPEHR